MQILIADEYYYEFDNYGDVALFDAMARRLHGFWPEAEIRVVTAAPDDLAARWPYVEPIEPEWHHAWLACRYQPFLGEWSRRLPMGLPRRIALLERTARRRWPAATRAFLDLKGKLRGHPLEHAHRFDELLARADLVVMTGGGHFVDGAEYHAINVLKVLKYAISRGTPTAMVSQGILQMGDPELLEWMRLVLPKVDLIAVREGRDALPVLRALGVPEARIIVTGDDAIEAAFENRTLRPGRGLGVNLRIASYSGVEHSEVRALGRTLGEAARRHDAPLVPVPISAIPKESDVKTIRELLSEYDSDSDGGEGVDTIEKAIAQAGRCRVVVTGSYHGGVFALAQGIPVVGLAKSRYYHHKFGGLADQWGTGCEVIDLNEQGAMTALSRAIDRLWQSADELREGLLGAAVAQIASGHEAYRRLYDLAGRVNRASITASAQGIAP